MLHSIVGGLISQFAGAGFASGAAGAGLNEALINNLKGIDPTIAQIASGVLGAAAAKIVNGDATAGATAAASGTKHNFFGGAAAASMSPQIMAALTGYVIVVYAGVQYIQNTATNEIVAQLQQDGNWLLNNVDSTLESVFKEHNIPYSQPQTLNGPHYYITPPITVNPPDHEHFPFDLSPNILDLKHKPYTNFLFDFKEQWSSQDFSDGNRFFTRTSGKEKANDRPSWAKGERPEPGESGKDFAKRVLDRRYGKDRYKKGPNSEYNQLKKWGDRGGKNK